MPFVYQAFADPLVGLLPLGLLFMGYLAKVRPIGPLPMGLVAMLLGTALYWCGFGQTGNEPNSLSAAASHLNVYLPLPVIGDIFSALDLTTLSQIAAVTIAMGLMNVLGSIQNLASAAAAGDDFADAPSLAVNGGGTLLLPVLVPAFPTTIYIGHPGWKALGARHGYSILNAVLMTLICCSGSVALLAAIVPQTAVLAVVVWIGIVITAQSFQTTPSNLAPAVVIGLLPGIAAWGVLMLKTGLSLGGVDFSGAALPGNLPAVTCPLPAYLPLNKALYSPQSFGLPQLWLGSNGLPHGGGLAWGWSSAECNWPDARFCGNAV